MKIKKLSLSLILLVLLPTQSNAELGFSFKNPAFNGNGYSSHMLSVEQLQHNRKSDLQDKYDAEQRRIERELENTTLNKFITNLESRIYATLSKQMVDSMFADCTGDTCPTT